MAKENEIVKELDAVDHEDDFFDKLLKEEIDPLADDSDDTDESKNKVEDDKGDKADEQDKPKDDTVESLRAQIAEMERERKGQLDSVVKSRQERSRFKSELNELKDAVSSLLAARQKDDNALNLDEEKDKGKVPLTDPRASVKFEENGDSAYVDLSEVKEAIEKSGKATRDELAALKAEREAEAAKQAFIDNVGSVINQNKEVYSVAYQELGKHYEDLNNKIIELQERTGTKGGEDGTISQDEALDLFSGSPEEEAFLKEHPGIDPTRVARAFNSKLDLKIGLTHLADALKIGVKADEDKGGLDDKLLKAKEKPGGLASHGNRKAEDSGDLIQRISTLSNEDVESLSDAEVAKIEQMLLREELRGN